LASCQMIWRGKRAGRAARKECLQPTARATSAPDIPDRPAAPPNLSGAFRFAVLSVITLRRAQAVAPRTAAAVMPIDYFALANISFGPRMKIPPPLAGLFFDNSVAVEVALTKNVPSSPRVSVGEPWG